MSGFTGPFTERECAKGQAGLRSRLAFTHVDAVIWFRFIEGDNMRHVERLSVLAVSGLLLCGFCPPLKAQQTTVTAGFRTLPVAPLGEPNPWPQFRFQLKGGPVAVSDALSEEDRAGMAATAAVPPLPYLMQDNYTRERRPDRLPTVAIENAFLRAVVYPSLGGRLMSLYDKAQRRELLFDNPVFQPANLAIRNAWFSGGVEWNGPLYGHSLLTCSPVFAGVVETPCGALLRLYEFDRALETAWQVDLYLPQEGRRLWVHVRALNPNSHDINFYWWTNIAVPMTSGTRVFASADYALSHEASGNVRLPFPVFDTFDGSYPSRYPFAKSVFFRKPGRTHAWSAVADGQGRGMSHVSTSTLFGRKFFTWGTGRGGKRWMDFLSEDDAGDYLEIQGGVTPTQLQTRQLKAGESIAWTECLSPFSMDAKAAHDENYAAACRGAEQVIDREVSLAALQEMDDFLHVQADTPVRTVLARGSGWGMLHEKRTGKRLSPGLAFETALGEDERPWDELLTLGTFSEKTLGQQPRSYAVSPGWTAALRASMQAAGATPLHHLHVGVAQLEAGAFDEARRSFEASLALKANAAAFRNLALLLERGGDPDAAQGAYSRAWKLCGEDPNLAVEFCGFLVRHKRHAAFRTFVERLPPPVAAHERIQLMQAQLALLRGDYSFVRQLLQREFCTIREGELSLSELWFASFVQEAEKRKGGVLTEAEKQDLMAANPPPRMIDFRMK